MMNPKNKRRVFVLHSYPLVREWLARLIELQVDLSFCGGANTFTEAFAEVTGLHPDITIIGSRLLNESAIGRIRDLRRVAPSTKVIVLSAWEDEEEAKQALLSGALGYTSRSSQIVAAIRRVLDGELFPCEKGCVALLASS